MFSLHRYHISSQSRVQGCRSFGGPSGDFHTIFKDFKDDSSVSFALVPAVRDPSGGCVDEDNCDYEKATVCAFSQLEIAKQVEFLACMDDSDDEALEAAKKCSSSTGVDASKLESCFNGSDGNDLLEAASKVWNKYEPGRAYIPKVLVNGEDEQSDRDNIINAICADGSSASVCNGNVLSMTARFCAV